MVDKFKLILTKLQDHNIPVSLFAILKIDDIADRWSVVFSNPNIIDGEQQQDIFTQLVAIILDNMSPEEKQLIARVGVFPLSNHLVESLMAYKKNHVFTEKTPVNGNTVFECYILESDDSEQRQKSLTRPTI